MATKTHWKKVVSDPNYIGEADFQDGEEKVLTIERVNTAETVKTAEGKTVKAVVHWKEKGYKPMILNVARSKSIEKVAGSGYFEDWPGVQVQLFIDHGIRAFGEIVSAVRVRPFKPRIQNQQNSPLPVCSDCKKPLTPAHGMTAQRLAEYTMTNYGAVLCAECATKRKQAKQPELGMQVEPDSVPTTEPEMPAADPAEGEEVTGDATEGDAEKLL